MKKIFWLFMVLSASVVMFNSCGDDNDEPGGGGNSNSTTDVGVVINGVKWATRNVDAVGTFAPTPESPGKFYQWGKNVAWNATGSATGWTHTDRTGSTWIRANDPSPTSWRVPNLDEVKSLCDAEKVTYQWITQNGVNGGKFTDKLTGNSIFLPAVGYRSGSPYTGISDVAQANEYGRYWTRTKADIPAFSTYTFYFGNTNDSPPEFNIGSPKYDWTNVSHLYDWGYSIRPVAE